MNILSLVITQLNFLIGLPVTAPVVVAKPAIIVAVKQNLVIEFPILHTVDIDKRIKEAKIFERQQ